jgi:hypothetical protein
LVGVDVWWWDHPVCVVFSDDFPALVVHAEVTVFAEEYPVGDVGAAVFGCPFVEVVGFGV